MQAMILAAGRGNRMRPLTDHLPKPLLSVGGKPLIVWHIERLVQAGISNIVINHAWLGHKLEEALGDGKHFGATIRYSPEPTGGLETAGGIRHALPLLGKNPFLVINGDIWCDWNPIHTIDALHHFNHSAIRAWLLMVNNPEHHPEGDFYINNDGLLQKEGHPKLTFAGVGIYHPHLFTRIQAKESYKLAPLLSSAMTRNAVIGEHYTGQWFDVGTPHRLTQLESVLSAQWH